MSKEIPLEQRTGSIKEWPEGAQPLGDRVLIKRLLDEDKTASGLILPTGTGNDDHNPWRGVVVACGPGDKMVRLICQTEGCGVSRFWNATRDKANECIFCGRKEAHVVYEGKRDGMCVRPGDEVLFVRSPACEVMIGGELHVLIHEEQAILAVLEPSTA
jgi:co-chaperonin GroES (HSP10)